MLDPGATRCVVNRKIVNDLNLPIENKSMRVVTIDSVKDGSREVTSFMISDLGGVHSFPVSGALVGDVLTLENGKIFERDISKIVHLELDG